MQRTPSPTYLGEFPANSDLKLSHGTVWFLYHHLKRLNTSTIGAHDDRVSGGLQIATARQNLALNGYYPRFRLETMQVSGIIWSGSGGRIWKAKFGENSEMFAVKQMRSDKQLSDIWKERDFLILLKGTRIVNLVGAFFHTDVFFAMELCHAPLSFFINQLSPQNKTRFLLQLGDAVQWIHSKNIIHCAVHPNNCLITTSNNLVVSGFGSAIKLKDGNDSVESGVKRGHCGYQDYECNLALSFSKASDMFSLGCVMFEILTGKTLLQYRNNKIKRKEYALAFKTGRVRNLGPHDKPTNDSVRQPLSERVQKSGRMANILVQLVAERKQRLTADVLSTHPTILSEYEYLASKDWKFENGDDFVTTDFALESMTTKFKMLSAHDSLDVHIALTGIYFDENETEAANPPHGKALNSYETHVAPNLLSTLPEKDPKSLGQVKTILTGYQGRLDVDTQRNPEVEAKRVAAEFASRITIQLGENRPNMTAKSIVTTLPPLTARMAHTGALTSRKSSSETNLSSMLPPTLSQKISSPIMTPPPRFEPAKKTEFAIPPTFFKAKGSTAFGSLPSSQKQVKNNGLANKDEKSRSTMAEKLPIQGSSSSGVHAKKSRRKEQNNSVREGDGASKAGCATAIVKKSSKNFPPSPPPRPASSKELKRDLSLSSDDEDNEVTTKRPKYIASVRKTVQVIKEPSPPHHESDLSIYRCQYCHFESENEKAVQNHQKKCALISNNN